MSVLQRKELEDSPLADLHAIASELGIEGYRALRREDLVAAVLDVQGGNDTSSNEPASDESADEQEPASERPSRSTGRARRGRGRGRSRDEVEDKPESEEPEGEVDDEPEAEAEQVAADEDEEREVVAGVLDVLPNGSGFLRVTDGPDVYVSPAQIRRCEMRPGDEVAGPVRTARRNERYPSRQGLARRDRRSLGRRRNASAA